jgi:hypothetical protein
MKYLQMFAPTGQFVLDLTLQPKLRGFPSDPDSDIHTSGAVFLVNRAGGLR